jgi:hypothetical protein
MSPPRSIIAHVTPGAAPGGGNPDWWNLWGTGSNADTEVAVSAANAVDAGNKAPQGPWLIYGPFPSQNAALDFVPANPPLGAAGSVGGAGGTSGGKGGGGSGGSGGGSGGSGGTLSVATISQLAEWMAAQVGHCYLYGGAFGAAFNQCGDCSAFCNYGWGKVAGQAIPGYPAGTYTGAQHGPSTVTWLASQGGVTGSVSRADAQAGDLATWPTHMGFCLSNNEMVSAQDPENGVQISGIDGFIAGEALTILRLAVVGAGGISFPISGLADQGQINHVIREIAQSSRNLVWTGMRIPLINQPQGRP